MVDRRERATKVIGDVFPVEPFVFKDPRICLTLPFWRTVIAPPEAAVLVYRDPLEVAGSMQARNGITLTHGLALWERYVRSAAASLDGIPTLVVGFDRVLSDPVAWCGELAEFLGAVGIGFDPSAVDRATRSLDGGLRHVHPTERGASGIHETQVRILAALEARDGAHDSWVPPELGPEPTWVEDVLAMRRALLEERGRHGSSTSPVARARRLIGRSGRGSPAG
jgi:hypothetical protein